MPVFSDSKAPKGFNGLGEAISDLIGKALELGDFTGKTGTTAWLTGDGPVQRIVLVGAGKSSDFAASGHRQMLSAAANALLKGKAKDALVHLADLKIDGETLPRVLEWFSRELAMTAYHYDETLSEKKPKPSLKKVTVDIGDELTVARARLHLEIGQSIANGANLARELVNLPGNICTPRYLSSQARKLARRYTTIKATVLDEKKMKSLGMGSLLSVGHGSDEPSQLIIMEYKGAGAKTRPYALVGKGITFDTGGISLKPGPKMDEMKFDMGGAGSVFGTLQAIADMELPINVVGVVAAAENMPSGRATKPGDVVTSMSGQTIEVLNTDAEGRLVLCDALTYVGRYNPAEVVDIATLTGAIIVSLGNVASGVFANDDELAATLVQAGQQCHDRAWQLPIWSDYDKQLESKFADIANIGSGPGAGSITAACFLARFTKDYRWAHLDVAGTAFRSAPKGATGRPVPLLVEYLRKRAGK
ncbi:cytosol aminopeptidase [Luminiphilus syltensis NOR5-1B]|uniref:Probable cytosol aminopeptidase n=1 Tax=Luminiphilus syltensis NOR5-1B TaxID=565045 RepID=B8KR04_9GAMM|nr:cytosol aminopeptidase [Luminiphilus syltensis NOR5-1B]